jgi:hypothetical protein
LGQLAGYLASWEARCTDVIIDGQVDIKGRVDRWGSRQTGCLGEDRMTGWITDGQMEGRRLVDRGKVDGLTD